MKLRIQGNSLRLRLSRSEVMRFNDKLIIEDTINFGSSKLTYILSVSQDVSAVCAKYNGDVIEVKVPPAIALDWAGTDCVSVSTEQTLDGGNTLKLLIEKDFKCVHNSPDANADAYPNPLAAERKLAD
jgi:hypothetical protein